MDWPIVEAVVVIGVDLLVVEVHELWVGTIHAWNEAVRKVRVRVAVGMMIVVPQLSVHRHIELGQKVAQVGPVFRARRICQVA
jgi:hypothetical protein